MSFSSPMTVPSGMSLQVLEVEGRSPQDLEDFAGEVSFLVDLDPPHLVTGCGVVPGTTVRFHEKDLDNSGKDIRVWTVRAEGSRFVGEHAAQSLGDNREDPGAWRRRLPVRQRHSEPTRAGS